MLCCRAILFPKIVWITIIYISFQDLFAKLTRMASFATDMFVGRERFATVLLMRLCETVILWLSEDQSFWEEIEEGPKPLGPLGLQQVHFHNTLHPPNEKEKFLTCYLSCFNLFVVSN
jgi:hypothetical protein